jgi:hypothetical protein
MRQLSSLFLLPADVEDGVRRRIGGCRSTDEKRLAMSMVIEA